MNPVNIIPFMAAALFLSMNCIASGESELSYADTVNLISKTMSSNTSAARKESYAYIKIDNCVLSYKVSGTFPVGTLYDIKFSNIDFSNLDRQQSNTGHDYTDFILLNFKKPARYQFEAADIAIHTVVINTADVESTKTLLKAFLHLGELCGTSKLP